ncbi:tail tube [Synechococcus phage S-SCSM1]|uniref:Tail tube protein n=1 Tax=Synechococcus phage S-SCSM1 TaxID=2588487 RepID=A0A6M2ZHS2_9CAUD|nr:tail tube [Synechococcus phage S-SCSM1]QFG06474.1 tail tube protein [Synechococcus phage S-SCSM1]
MAAPGPSVQSMSNVKARLMYPATTSFYEVYFTPPGRVIANAKQRYGLTVNSSTYEYIKIACNETSLPGSRLTTHEATNDFAGVTEKSAYRRQYDGEISLTYYVDRDYSSIRLFESWIGFVGGENNSALGPIGNYNPMARNTGYRVAYPADYQIDNLSITKFEKDVGRSDYKSRLQYTFLGAFPLSINSMPVSYGPSDVLRVTVNMSYVRYVVNYSPANAAGKNTSTNDTRPSASDPNSAVLDGINEQGSATVYDPYGSQVTFYDNNQTVNIGGREYTTSETLDF